MYFILVIKVLRYTEVCAALNTFGASTVCMSQVSSVTYQLHNSLAECARELFKPSKDVASLLV